MLRFCYLKHSGSRNNFTMDWGSVLPILPLMNSSVCGVGWGFHVFSLLSFFPACVLFFWLLSLEGHESMRIVWILTDRTIAGRKCGHIMWGSTLVKVSLCVLLVGIFQNNSFKFWDYKRFNGAKWEVSEWQGLKW